jgi:hypothetical protein
LAYDARELTEDLLPVRRAELCVSCNADLHVCKMCGFFNPSVANACEETIATAVSNKERSNYCEYFKPSVHAYKGGTASAAARARSELEQLFGGQAGDAAHSDGTQNQSELERLFGIKKD